MKLIHLVHCYNYRNETDHQTRGSYEHICELERVLSDVKDERERGIAEWRQKVCGLSSVRRKVGNVNVSETYLS